MSITNTLRKIKSCFGPQGKQVPLVVLLYHRIAEQTEVADPNKLSVSSNMFERQLKAFKKDFDVIGLGGELRTIARPSIAITFDDGYADNFYNALPILEANDVPATFFISVGNVLTGDEFWWDELASLVFLSKTIPESLMTKYLPNAKGIIGIKMELYKLLRQKCLDLNAMQRSDFIDSLRRDIVLPSSVTGYFGRPMNARELVSLARSSLVTIGAHTMSHSRLSSLRAPEQEEEIGESKRKLEDMLKRPVDLFSYPFGDVSDVNEESISICRREGFSKAFVSYPGKILFDDNNLLLNRFMVQEWSPSEIYGRIKKAF